MGIVEMISSFLNYHSANQTRKNPLDIEDYEIGQMLAKQRLQAAYPNPPLEPIIKGLKGYYSDPKNIANTVMDFLPGIGDVKSAQEAITGTSLVNQEDISKWWERGLSAVGALPLVPSLAGIIAKTGDKIKPFTEASKGDKMVEEAKRIMKKTPQPVGGKFGSVNYHEAKQNQNLLTAKESADYLGVTENWLRKNIEPTEWHHSNLKYGSAAKAYFWNQEHLSELRDYLDKGEFPSGTVDFERPGKKFKEKFWKFADSPEELAKAVRQQRNIPTTETPKTPEGGIGKIKILEKGIDDYLKDPHSLIDDIVDIIGEDDPSAIVLRGIHKKELGKKKLKNSYMWEDNIQTSKRLKGTCGLLVTGTWSDDPVSNIVNNLEKYGQNAKSYGGTDYIAIVKGTLETDEIMEDLGEAVISNPQVIGYIRKSSLPKPSLPAKD